MSSLIDNKNNSTNSTEHSIEKINEQKDTIQIEQISLSISTILEELLIQNSKLSYYKKKIYEQSKMVFSCHKKPKISILEYINRIIKYTYLEKSSLIVSLIYLDRICQNDILLTDYNIHRLLFISIMVNIKFMEDKHFLNSFYAMICDVKLSYLNKMEYEFLSGIQFQLLINKNVYYKYRNLILKQE
jgi:hypothetical protein